MIGDARVYIIAEVGSNHGGELGEAYKLIDAAAFCGADAVKFQYFRVDRFLIPRPGAEVLAPLELPFEWLHLLYEYCVRRGVDFLCTAFDLQSLNDVDPYVKAHKIGSWEAVLPSYRAAVRAKGKPVIVSMGKEKIPPELGTIRLVCRSDYPAAVEGYLWQVPRGRGIRSPRWGVSDHTLDPLTVPCAAVAMGARVVEKHIRMPWRKGYPDETVSVTIDDFKRMADAIRRTEAALAP